MGAAVPQRGKGESELALSSEPVTLILTAMSAWNRVRGNMERSHRMPGMLDKICS